jgi:predicted CXXCH cytochrome family protein
MAAATDATVRGDFNNARIDFKGSTGRFFRDGARFMVETEGSDGKLATFAVSHTFGVAPLQQYLVTFPDGRLQALPWAWDTREKAAGGQRWFHLYQNEAIPASDPLHWTRPLQNWNFMCAECHSTAVRKNYDAVTDTYHTVFSEISVGCEACHGAAAGHVAWATGARNEAVPNRGFATEAARRPTPDWTGNPVTGSPAHGVSRPAGDEVETCALCHSRRAAFSERWQPGQPLADTHLEDVLDVGLFEDDGQMKDEVYNDQSFKQSLMYARGVVCTDCHDPHAGGLKLAGAAVCSQCHQPARFATVEHTGHAPGARAPDCISCHMPARTYMVVDNRHDHSFRIPRPDISAAIGMPNTCNDCHRDKTASWAAAAIEHWHGPVRHGFQTWGSAIHLARAENPQARPMLRALAANQAVPAIARATIIGEMQRFLSAQTDAATEKALHDPDPLVRIAALRAQAGLPIATRWQRANPLLSDNITAVRLQAALLLADQPRAALSPTDQARLNEACAEYEATQRLNADRAEGRANLGAFLIRRGSPTAAETEFRAGLKLDPLFVPLYVNLADLYRAEGREPEAAALARQAIAIDPEAAAPHLVLGLSLIRQKKYTEALPELARAAALAPEQPRYAYIYAVALQSTGDEDGARRQVNDALARHPGDRDLLTLAVQDALSTGDTVRAAELANRLSELKVKEGQGALPPGPPLGP